MPKARVIFTVTAGDGVLGYWIAVDDKDVKLINGSGPTDLETRKSHRLVWWFTGKQGAKLSVQGKRPDKVVVEIKESKIPDGERDGAGSKRFDL